MRKAELQRQAIALIEQLYTEELEVVVELLTDLQNRLARDTAYPIDPDAEIALKKTLEDYERAYKTLAKREAVLFFSRSFVCDTFLVHPDNCDIIWILDSGKAPEFHSLKCKLYSHTT